MASTEKSNIITIKSEGDAFSILEKMLKRGSEDQHPYTLQFDGWPVIQIRLRGEGFNSTITADIAESLVELQSAIDRTYARLVRGFPDARKLKAEERRMLRFKAKVEEGSSLFTIKLGEFAEKIASALIGKMTGSQMVILVLGVAVVMGGSSVWKQYLQEQTEQKKIDAETQRLLTLTQEETNRAGLMYEIVARRPEVAHTKEDFDFVRGKVVRSIGDANSISINGLELGQDAARAIASPKRAESKDIQLNGNYLISMVDHSYAGKVKLRVKRDPDGKEFIADFTDYSLNEEQIQLLQEAEWERRLVYLSINATELRGEITTAKIVSVDAQPDSVKPSI